VSLALNSLEDDTLWPLAMCQECAENNGPFRVIGLVSADVGALLIQGRSGSK
jgi:hypothetical protein